MAASV